MRGGAKQVPLSLKTWLVQVTAKMRSTFPNGHMYHINSLSVNRPHCPRMRDLIAMVPVTNVCLIAC